MTDAANAGGELGRDVASGLGATPKSLPSRWLYQGAGSDLFVQITELPEYYPTRAERMILEEYAGEMAAACPATVLIELGSGSSIKTQLLLDAFDAAGQLEAFVAVDVVESAVREVTAQVSRRFPRAAVTGAVADFTGAASRTYLTHAPSSARPEGRRLVVFLGGTIGNLDPTQRRDFLADLSGALDDGDHVLIGTDLVKDPARILAAYDDSQGVTAAFEKNVLAVINDVLGADFRLDRFDYVARWDAKSELVEMGLASRGQQDVSIAALGMHVHFEDGETILTEISAKFRPEGFARELAAAAFTVVRQWPDAAGDFLLTLARRSAA